MSLAHITENKISVDEYLEGEILSEIKHEYIDGEVYAMAGASTKHNLISSNTLYELKSQLKQNNSFCDVFSSDMKVKVNSDITTSFYYPDVMVCCENNKGDDHYQNTPVIIVEVLSQSTRKNDYTTKMHHYFSIPSLQEYVLIEQDICQVQIYKRSDDWKSKAYFPGDEINFESINSTVSVEDIYYHVDNKDLVEFIKDKEEKEA